MPYFLDNVLHYFDTTNPDFAHIETEYMFIFGPREHFVKNYWVRNVFNERRQ